MLIDATLESATIIWTASICAPFAAVAVSGGFFGLAFFTEFRWLLYLGGLTLLALSCLPASGSCGV